MPVIFNLTEMSLCRDKYGTGLGSNKEDSTDVVEPNSQDNKCLQAQQIEVLPVNDVNPFFKSEVNTGKDEERFKSLSSNSNNARIVNESEAPFAEQFLQLTNIKTKGGDGDVGSDEEVKEDAKLGDFWLLRQQYASQERELLQLRETVRQRDSWCTEAEAEVVRLRSALITSEKARSRQSALLSRSLVDREVIASEARACERELSEVEAKIHHLTAEILTRESRIVQLEDEVAGRREAEAKSRQITMAFEETLREQAEQLRAQFCTENEEATVAKIDCLEREIENLKASHAETIDAITKRDEARAQADAHTIHHLQHKIIQLQAQLESQGQEIDDLKKRNNRLEADHEHFDRFSQSMQIRVEETEVKVVRERAKADQLEAELIACRGALASSERNLRDLTLEQEVARERIAASARRFETMHAQIVELDASLRASAQQNILLEAKAKESEQTIEVLERRLDQVEKEAKKSCDWIRHLEEENVALRTTNQQLNCTVDEMRSSCTNLKCQGEDSNLEIAELKSLLTRFEMEREADEAMLSESLRVAGIPLSNCLEVRNSESEEPSNLPPSKHTQKRRVLDVARAAALLTNRIASVEAENTRLGDQIATQEAHLVEQRAQTASLNDNLLQLEAHLRNAREDNKRLSLQQVSLRRQLESQKCSTARYREEKHVLQERLARCDQMLKRTASFNSFSNPGKFFSDREVELFAELATFFDKAKGVSKVRNKGNEVKRSPTESAETGVVCQDTRKHGQSLETGKCVFFPSSASSAQLAKVASAIMAECVDSKGRFCTDTFRSHLRKALDIPQHTMSPHRLSHKVTYCGVDGETISAPRLNGDGADK
ncbi:hypothetical protein EGR_10001 [Echinococcus granulosus]|uniref:Uncharacterized protein n=2 Tax=Echinococcus granulosus TaxID=6210 RepID=W6U3J4_ECHGR|nr:hypothetical protein EGR_10001 [Echinococcus granulosus]EUB55141.1 hypothetical protein EGR_10001 [Echinococcus granulosus]